MLIASQLLFDFIVPNIVTKHIGKGTKKLEKLTETFEYETTRSDFKCCDDGFRNEPVVQCDAQVVKSTFVDYSK